jgi:hypothetical protein
MSFWLKMPLLALPSIFLVWSGINAVRRRKTYFGRGYCNWTGRKAVILGYCWLLLGLILFVLGLVMIC